MVDRVAARDHEVARDRAQQAGDRAQEQRSVRRQAPVTVGAAGDARNDKSARTRRPPRSRVRANRPSRLRRGGHGLQCSGMSAVGGVRPPSRPCSGDRRPLAIVGDRAVTADFTRSRDGPATTVHRRGRTDRQRARRLAKQHRYVIGTALVAALLDADDRCRGIGAAGGGGRAVHQPGLRQPPAGRRLPLSDLSREADVSPVLRGRTTGTTWLEGHRRCRVHLAPGRPMPSGVATTTCSRRRW